MIKTALLTMGIVFAIPATVEAASPRSLGQFGDWSAAIYQNGATSRCFVMSEPADKEPSTLRHGEVFFFVQTGEQKAATESSFQTGYDFAENSTVTVTIGDESFRMLTQGSNAWLERLEREPALLAAMRGGRDMILEARSARGNVTTYRFSLTGVTAASRMLARCDEAAASS